MQQTKAFLGAFKRGLKARGMTYADLAKALGLSEASVKRLFSRESLTLARAEEIATALDMTLLDVAKLAASASDSTSSELTLEQEKALAADPCLFSLFHLLLFGRKLPKLLQEYEISKESAERATRALESLGLVERTPRGTVRLLVKRSVSWRARGPLREAYELTVRRQFLDGAFEGDDALRKFATRRLSAASRALMIRKLKRLMTEMDGLSEVDAVDDEDTGAPTKGDVAITSLFVAFRPFEFDGAVGLRKRG